MHSIVGDAKSSDIAGCLLMRRGVLPHRAQLFAIGITLSRCIQRYDNRIRNEKREGYEHVNSAQVFCRP